MSLTRNLKKDMAMKKIVGGMVEGVKLSWFANKAAFRNAPLFASLSSLLGLGIVGGSVWLWYQYNWYTALGAYVAAGILLNVAQMAAIAKCPRILGLR